MPIREAVASEAEMLSQIAMASKASHGYSEEFLEACRAELTCSPAQIESAEFTFLVAEVNGEAVGFVCLATLPDKQCEIDSLFVLPDHSGCGIGSELMRVAMDVALKSGCVSVQIQSDPGAVSFYERFGAVQNGFTESGSIPGRMLPQLVIET